MLAKCKGIVIRVTKYSETSVIVKMYTDQFGVVSYLVNGVRSGKAKNKAAYFKPLNLLDMQAYYRENKGLQRIKEYRMSHIYGSLPFDPIKSSVGFLIIDVLNKSLQEEEANEQLYDFIQHSLIQLDQYAGSLALYPHYFMLQLTKHLGFYPHGKCSDSSPYFNLMDGDFCAQHSHDQLTIDGVKAEAFSVLKNADDLPDVQLNKSDRQALLHHICDYYRLHVENFGQLRSLDVLSNLF